MQVKEVKVKFEENGKEYSFDTSNVFVRIGDRVVVDTARGQEMGTICSRVKQIEAGEGEYKKVLRIATEQDLQNKENISLQVNNKYTNKVTTKTYSCVFLEGK